MPADAAEAERGIAVLGMHRSGTSCLTGLLEDAGVFLGDVQRRNPHNPLGNRENLRITRLHDAVLADNGARWDAPPRDTVVWSEAQRAELADICARYRERAPWAFKDPRALFTLEAWQEECPELRMIGTVRHPVAVARSLEARSGMAPDAGLALWTRYNERLLALRERFGFDVVCFDDAPAAYLETTARAFARLGLAPPEGGLRFFRDDLRRQRSAGSVEVPAEMRALHERLGRACAET